ncbi:hypothetical protein AURDEDRAFT_176752 [Auricularia subglabra TFB-10046 SS5]|nr:hypothetical protein AURDEDRAFT_176752 [Auricularia subglabra TFB-10046 SS5]
MAKKQTGAVEDPAPPPRRSSRRGVAPVEDPAPQVAVPARGGGRRASARGAGSTEIPSTPAAPAKPRGRPRRATQQDEDGASPAARKTAGSRRNVVIPGELREPAGQLEDEDQGSEDDTEGQCSRKRKRRVSSATRRRKARAAANARARAAEDAVSSEEELDEPSINADEEHVDGDRHSVEDAADNDGVEELGSSRGLRVPRGSALTPSPRKNATPGVEDEASQDEGEAFVRAKNVGRYGMEQPGKGSAPKPKRNTPDVDSDNRLGRQQAPPRGPSRKSSGNRGQDKRQVADTRDVAEDDLAREDVEAEDDDDARPKARRHTKAVREELAEAARVSALEELGSRMVGMLGQLKDAGIRLDFAAEPVQFAAAPEVEGGSTEGRPDAAASPVKGRSRADNFKGDGSSREGKPVTEGRKYGAVWGSYDDFDVGLNVSDYSRKNNDAPRDNTELFYPLVRKAYAMNRFRESYVAVIAMPVSGDLKGQTYAWGSPRLLKDLPDFLDDCAFEIAHGTMDKRAHGYAKALSDYKRKALKDLVALNRKHAQEQGMQQGEDAEASVSGDVANTGPEQQNVENGKERAVDPRTPARVAKAGPEQQNVEKGKERAVDLRTPARVAKAGPEQQNVEKGKERAANPRTPARAVGLPSTPDVGQKRKRAQGDDGDEERPVRQIAGGRPVGGGKSKAAKISDDQLHRRPLTPRNASARVPTADAMDIDADV